LVIKIDLIIYTTNNRVISIEPDVSGW